MVVTMVASWTVVLISIIMCLCIMDVSTKQSRDRRELHYEHFDDYLVSVAAQPAPVVREMARPRGRSLVVMQSNTTTPTPTASGDHPDSPDEDETVSYQDILGYFRDVPREHWSCCMLGMLAGNKGFHCHAGFYAVRISQRNVNRAHTRRMPFHGRHRVARYGRQIMHTFSRCVSRHSNEFHNCCHAATVERQERMRWQHFRDMLSGHIADE